MDLDEIFRLDAAELFEIYRVQEVEKIYAKAVERLSQTERELKSVIRENYKPLVNVRSEILRMVKVSEEINGKLENIKKRIRDLDFDSISPIDEQRTTEVRGESRRSPQPTLVSSVRMLIRSDSFAPAAQMLVERSDEFDPGQRRILWNMLRFSSREYLKTYLTDKARRSLQTLASALGCIYILEQSEREMRLENLLEFYIDHLIGFVSLGRGYTFQAVLEVVRLIKKDLTTLFCGTERPETIFRTLNGDTDVVSMDRMEQTIIPQTLERLVLRLRETSLVFVRTYSDLLALVEGCRDLGLDLPEQLVLEKIGVLQGIPPNARAVKEEIRVVERLSRLYKASSGAVYRLYFEAKLAGAQGDEVSTEALLNMSRIVEKKVEASRSAAFLEGIAQILVDRFKSKHGEVAKAFLDKYLTLLRLDHIDGSQRSLFEFAPFDDSVRIRIPNNVSIWLSESIFELNKAVAELIDSGELPTPGHLAIFRRMAFQVFAGSIQDSLGAMEEGLFMEMADEPKIYQILFDFRYLKRLLSVEVTGKSGERSSDFERFLTKRLDRFSLEMVEKHLSENVEQCLNSTASFMLIGGTIGGSGSLKFYEPERVFNAQVKVSTYI